MNNEENIELFEENINSYENLPKNEDSLNDVISKNAKSSTESTLEKPKKKSLLELKKLILWKL